MVMKMFYTLLASVCVLALAACDATSVTLTQENLDKVHDGMMSAQVKAILGSPTASKDEPIPVVGGTKTTYIYENKSAPRPLSEYPLRCKEPFVGRNPKPCRYGPLA
jgi:hypothetical protein